VDGGGCLTRLTAPVDPIWFGAWAQASRTGAHKRHGAGGMGGLEVCPWTGSVRLLRQCRVSTGKLKKRSEACKLP